MLHLCGPKRKAASRATDKARNDKEEKVYNKLEEDGGRKTIYKLACDRDEDVKDMKKGAVIKVGGGRIVTKRGQC